MFIAKFIHLSIATYCSPFMGYGTSGDNITCHLQTKNQLLVKREQIQHSTCYGKVAMQWNLDYTTFKGPRKTIV